VARCQGCHERGRHLRRIVTTPSSTVFVRHALLATGPSGYVSETCRPDGRSGRQKNLLALMSVCEEVANNIEDHLTGG
jgi:hypothetical protein